MLTARVATSLDKADGSNYQLHLDEAKRIVAVPPQAGPRPRRGPPFRSGSAPAPSGALRWLSPPAYRAGHLSSAVPTAATQHCATVTASARRTRRDSGLRPGDGSLRSRAPSQTVICVSTCLTLGRPDGTRSVTDVVTGWQSKRPLLRQKGPLTCGFTVAGAGFEPATSGL